MAKRGKKRRKQSLAKRVMKAVFGRALPIVMILLLALLSLLSIGYEKYEPLRELLDSLGIITTSSSSGTTYIDPDGDELALHYIDVGQGDATLLQTGEGAVLIDCGVPDAGENLVHYIKSVGVSELEYLIITHPDNDHMGAAAYVMQNLTVKNIVLNGQTKNASFFRKALDEIEKQGINAIEASVGDILTVGALQMRILGPQEHWIDENDYNSASIIIHTTYGKRAFLFTGDAESKAEGELVASFGNEIKCDIFQAGHHGSRTSNSEAILNAAKPEYVVISCGRDNSYGHPHAEILNRFEDFGANISRTDREGTVVFVTDGENLSKR